MQMIVLLVCVGAVAAAPAAPSSTSESPQLLRPLIPIISYQNAATDDGGNKHAYTAGNGIEREEGVFLKEVTTMDDDGHEKMVKVPVYRGSYKYQQPDGTFIDVQYIADETGFHAVGDNIPKPLQ